jgi:hypothetical protein
VQKAANVLSMISGEAKQLSQNWNSMQPPSMLYGQSNRLQAGASAIGTSQSDGFHSFAVTKVSSLVKIRSHPSHGLNICNLGLKLNGPTSRISLAAELTRFKVSAAGRLSVIPLNNASLPAALPPRHRLRIGRSDNHLPVSGGINLPIAGAVRQLERGFAHRPAEAVREAVGEIDGWGGLHWGNRYGI